jgi:hypothetical protein
MVSPSSFRCDSCGKISSAYELMPVCARCRAAIALQAARTERPVRGHWLSEPVVEEGRPLGLPQPALWALLVVAAGLLGVLWLFLE